MRDFRNKVAAITGAGSGIGRALAMELARRGCHLALCDVNEEALRQTVEAASALGVKVTHRKVDVADRIAVHSWADDTAAEHGKVNLIFNNAGVALVATLENVSYEAFDWIVNINFWGVVHGSRAFLPHLRTAGEGHIVNLSSVFGIAGVPSQGTYNATKFAVRGFTECLRQELDIMNCGVSATSVHPGGIKTNIGRAARKDGDITCLGMSADDAGDDFEKIAMTTPDKAARIILRAVEKNKRRVLVGPDAYLFEWAVRLFPGGYQRIMPFFLKRALRQASLPAET